MRTRWPEREEGEEDRPEERDPDEPRVEDVDEHQQDRLRHHRGRHRERLVGLDQDLGPEERAGPTERTGCRIGVVGGSVLIDRPPDDPKERLFEGHRPDRRRQPPADRELHELPESLWVHDDREGFPVGNDLAERPERLDLRSLPGGSRP